VQKLGANNSKFGSKKVLWGDERGRRQKKKKHDWGNGKRGAPKDAEFRRSSQINPKKWPLYLEGKIFKRRKQKQSPLKFRLKGKIYIGGGHFLAVVSAAKYGLESAAVSKGRIKHAISQSEHSEHERFRQKDWENRERTRKTKNRNRRGQKELSKAAAIRGKKLPKSFGVRKGTLSAGEITTTDLQGGGDPKVKNGD